jgi:hypothetical protein
VGAISIAQHKAQDHNVQHCRAQAAAKIGIPFVPDKVVVRACIRSTAQDNELSLITVQLFYLRGVASFIDISFCSRHTWQD